METPSTSNVRYELQALLKLLNLNTRFIKIPNAFSFRILKFCGVIELEKFQNIFKLSLGKPVVL